MSAVSMTRCSAAIYFARLKFAGVDLVVERPAGLAL